MAKQTINLGTGELTGDGESIRSAFSKINENFDELYAQDANDVVLSAINGHIIPDTDVTYDLGSASNRFRDLYLSGSTIDLGGTTLSIVGGNLQVGGTDIKDVVVTAGVDYTEIQNTPDLSNYVTQAQLAAGSITVDVNNTGDLTGSVFADDSTLLVDGVNGKLVGDIEKEGILTVRSTGALGELRFYSADDILFNAGTGTGDFTVSANLIELGGPTEVDDTLTVTDSIVIQNGNDTIVIGDAAGTSFQLPNKGFSLQGGGVGGGNYVFGLTANGNGSIVTTNQFNLLSGAGMAIGTSTGLTIQGTVTVDAAVTAPSFVGDVTGSVFADDSTLLVDGVNGNIPLSAISELNGQEVRIGSRAGDQTTDTTFVAIGSDAGRYAGNQSIAIGRIAGAAGTNAIAIGASAGNINQGNQGIAIGYSAGRDNQGNYGIALGFRAGQDLQHDNTIIINADSGVSSLDSEGTNRFYVNPIRNASGTTFLQYNATTKEITHEALTTLTFPDATVQSTAWTGNAPGFTYNELGGTSEIGVTADVVDFGTGNTIDMQGNSVLFGSASIQDFAPGNVYANSGQYLYVTGKYSGGSATNVAFTYDTDINNPRQTFYGKTEFGNNGAAPIVDFTGATVIGLTDISTATDDITLDAGAAATITLGATSGGVSIGSVDGVNINNTGVGTINIGHSTNQTNFAGTVDFSSATITGTNFLTSETTTTLTADSVNQKLVFTDETGTANDIDLSWAVDDTNLARLTSGSLDGLTGIATFTRDDATTFTVDFSALLNITLADLSVGADAAASGSGGLAYNNSTGVFTYTPPDLSSYIDLTDLSVGAPAAASGSGAIAYDPLTGVFTYTPPDILNSFNVVSNPASGNGTLTYTNSTGTFTYTPPDLSSYLTSEANDLTTAVTWANVPDANITQSSVTQHEAALSINENQINFTSSFIELIDISATQLAASGNGSLSYNNSTGVFTYTPPDLSSYLTSETNDLTASVIWANVPDANITQSSVTQHQAALSITESQISDLGSYLTAESDTLDTVTDRGATTTNSITVGGLTTNGVLQVEQGTQEAFATLTNATGTVTHDCSNGHIFYHTTPSADWTANFTNLTLTAEYATALTIVINQGATAYIPTAVQIGGAAQTIIWQGGSAPSGTASGTDVVSFSVLNDGGTYIVLGNLSSFGGV